MESDNLQSEDILEEAVDGRDAQLASDTVDVMQPVGPDLPSSNQPDAPELLETSNPPAINRAPVVKGARERLLLRDTDSNSETTQYSIITETYGPGGLSIDVCTLFLWITF